MAIFNYKKREISAKIVYYGPALCGKTTNVQFIHQKLNPRQRGELVSLATDSDRTLFFDFLPIELENVGGFKTRFQIYTVPGQVYYNSTRKAVLTGVDGVIFVADSQTSMEQENLESFNNLIENLKYYNRDINQLPLILQYNKRDLDEVTSVKDLDNLFNKPGSSSFTASAVTGEGVLQTLTACCKQVLQDLKKKSQRAEQSATGERETKSSLAQNETVTPRVTTTNRVSPIPETGKISSPQPQALNPGKPDVTDREAKTTDSRPPFTFPGKQPEKPQPITGGEPFVPEIASVGKAQIINPYTITLPLRLATDGERQNLLNVDITIAIKDFCKTI